MKLQYTVSEQDNFFNIKELIKCKFNISDRLLTKLKKNNYIFLNSYFHQYLPNHKQYFHTSYYDFLKN